MDLGTVTLSLKACILASGHSKSPTSSLEILSLYFIDNFSPKTLQQEGYITGILGHFSAWECPWEHGSDFGGIPVILHEHMCSSESTNKRSLSDNSQLWMQCGYRKITFFFSSVIELKYSCRPNILVLTKLQPATTPALTLTQTKKCFYFETLVILLLLSNWDFKPAPPDETRTVIPSNKKSWVWIHTSEQEQVSTFGKLTSPGNLMACTINCYKWI